VPLAALESAVLPIRNSVSVLKLFLRQVCALKPYPFLGLSDQAVHPTSLCAELCSLKDCALELCVSQIRAPAQCLRQGRILAVCRIQVCVLQISFRQDGAGEVYETQITPL
jgi:hypothetical protein